jgi:hypothetical protein
LRENNAGLKRQFQVHRSRFSVYEFLCVSIFSGAQAAHAQQTPAPQPAPQESSQEATPPPAASGAPSSGTDEDASGKTGDRIFGVLPNYTTVEGARRIQPVSTKQMFHMAAQDAFDPPVFPFVVFTTWFGQIQGEESSWGTGSSAFLKRYATTFSDDVIATFMTTGVMPTLLHQDPRYFELGEGQGSAWHRAGYAATRSFVTRSRSGHTQFNFSDVTGNAIAAAMSNLYHPIEDRSWSETLGRWGTQMMWDVLSDELKEFWPDIRRRMRKR